VVPTKGVVAVLTEVVTEVVIIEEVLTRVLAEAVAPNHLVDNYSSGGGTADVFALTAPCLKHLGFEMRVKAVPLFLV
jgi:hypothetical protein